MARKYSVHEEDDHIISYEVDGVTYTSLDDIPDPEDRRKLQALSGEPAPQPAEADAFTPGDFSIFEKDPFFKTGADDEFDRLSAGAPKFDLSKLFLPLFGGIALLMLAIAAYSGYRTARALANEVYTDGWVVDMVERRGSDGSLFYYPVVEFYLPDDRLVRVPIAEGNWPPAYMKGEAVTIAYNPHQPLEARIKTGSNLAAIEWTLPIITGVLGLAFAGGAVLAWWILKDAPPGAPLDGSAAGGPGASVPGVPGKRASRKGRRPSSARR